MIQVYYTQVPTLCTEELFQSYLGQLPPALQAQNARYKRWKDRWSHLLGKMLLQEALRPYGDISLRQLSYNEYGRPFLPGDLDFNISHAGTFVLCAIGRGVKLGIDIEEVRPVDLGDFKAVMTSEQWRRIHEAANPTHEFFTCWTIKESVIKADSRGLSIPLHHIAIQDNHSFCEGRKWYLTPLFIDDNYCTCLACDHNGQEVVLQQKRYI